MSNALNLTPQGGVYLRTDIVQAQLSQNQSQLQLIAGNAAVVDNDPPTARFDGCGRAYLSGRIKLSNATPIAGAHLFKLPAFALIEKDSYLSVLKKSGSTFSSVGLNILNGDGSIDSITIDNPGAYTSMPTIGLTGPGSGATLVPRAYAISATLQSNPTGNTSYAPGDDVFLSDSSSSEVAAVLNVDTTGVYSAAIAAGGANGTNGAQVVTGTTGTGTKFTANVTITGGAITAVNSIATAGEYTVNPTNLAIETVSGAGIEAAALIVRMKPVTLSVVTPGSYLDFSTPIGQSGTTPGGGGGCTFNVTWGLLSIVATTPGTGYTDSSAVTITGGGGAGGGAASLNLSGEGSIAQSVGVLAVAATQNDELYLDGTVIFLKSY